MPVQAAVLVVALGPKIAMNDGLRRMPGLAPETCQVISQLEDMAKIEAQINDAKENLGDIEIRDALVAKAETRPSLSD